jgi:hypothetical protein
MSFLKECFLIQVLGTITCVNTILPDIAALQQNNHTL